MTDCALHQSLHQYELLIEG